MEVKKWNWPLQILSMLLLRSNSPIYHVSLILFTHRLRSALVRLYIGPFVSNFGTPLLLIILVTVAWCTLKVFSQVKKRTQASKKKE